MNSRDGVVGLLGRIFIVAALVVAVASRADGICEVTFSSRGKAGIARLSAN